MSAVSWRFLEPLDVLILRGNKLFGDPGSFGESLVPPWPSVAAGALRSRMLADDRVDLEAFADGKVAHSTLGTPKNPGSFTVYGFYLARRFADGRVEALIAPPADLVISKRKGDGLDIRLLSPVAATVENGLLSSYPLPLLPVLAQQERLKPSSGYWLTEAGWKKYLSSQAPEASDLVKSSGLWKKDVRVGVGLDAGRRSAAEGRLFSNQAVAMVKREQGAGFDTGFLVGVSGAEPPSNGMVRFGGDGRAAAVYKAEPWQMPEPNYEAMIRARRVRVILATPGLFGGGWLPAGVTESAGGEFRFELHGVRARLVAAAVPRAETVSGWDLAHKVPKAAQRVCPAGSVYWMDELEAQREGLLRLVEKGLWSEPCEDPQRRAEGFNRIWLAQW